MSADLIPWLAAIAAWLAAFAALGASLWGANLSRSVRVFGWAMVSGLVFLALGFVALGALIGAGAYLDPRSMWVE